MVLDQIFRGKIFLTYFRWFSLNNNFLFLKVMLSFGKAPAKSCGRGNSSTLPDYLPEDDEDTVISDKVSKEYPTQQTLVTCSWLFKNRVSKIITVQLSHGCSIVDYYEVEATPSSALLISSVTLTGYCLYTQAFGISDSGFDTCVTIYKMEKITPPFYSPLLNDKELNYTKEWHFLAKGSNFYSLVNNSFFQAITRVGDDKENGWFSSVTSFFSKTLYW